MTDRLAFFYDSKEVDILSLKDSLPRGVVLLDCSHQRILNIVKKYRFNIPCLVVGDTVVSGGALDSWLFETPHRPAVVQFFTRDYAEEDYHKTAQVRTKPETAIEKGKRLAAEREELFGAL